MKSVPELFAITLGRAAAAHRRMLRGLSEADRDDAIAATMLECWARREEVTSATSLDAWVGKALHRNVRAVQRAARPDNFVELKLNEIVRADSNTGAAHARIAAEKIFAKLSREERTVAMSLAEGHSLRAIAEKHKLSVGTIHRIKKRLRNFRDVMPDEPEFARYFTGLSADEMREPAPIDHEIERLLRRPPRTGADCPVCWRCAWFDGLTPKKYSPSQFEDKEIETAVRETEARKIRIGNGERL